MRGRVVRGRVVRGRVEREMVERAGIVMARGGVGGMMGRIDMKRGRVVGDRVRRGDEVMGGDN